MTSEWSPQTFSGADSALLATTITTGSLMADATYNTSCISSSPCPAVAVKVLAPTADAPRQALMAECSDSTGTYSAFSSPLATSSASDSTICVWGVIGYAAPAAASASPTACAPATDPSIPTSLVFSATYTSTMLMACEDQTGGD